MEKIRKQQGHVVARNHRDCKEPEIFVRFEISMLNSYDMTLVRDKYGIEGWGIVLYIMKYLIERRTDCRAPLYVVGEITHACHKNRRTILQLIADFPSLFEIEAGGKIFSSPYLLRFFLKTSAKKEKSNRSLDKLTNETLDNQEVSFPKNKNK
ncbi:MAG: FERM and PDZ domain-containing protein 3, partial [Segatella oris]